VTYLDIKRRNPSYAGVSTCHLPYVSFLALGQFLDRYLVASFSWAETHLNLDRQPVLSSDQGGGFVSAGYPYSKAFE
jgi:hypothetical protein